jgi:hypothetical protein
MSLQNPELAKSTVALHQCAKQKNYRRKELVSNYMLGLLINAPVYLTH